MHRHGSGTGIPRCGCWRDRAAARCCSAASPSAAPGWKTYWRTPGDSGVPPRFDFSKSENIEAVTVLWPAPLKFDDGAGGISLGYHNQIVLPLRIVAKNADKPVTLRAAINYAVCEKLCIPVEASAELAFTSVASTEDSALFAALDTVPKPANVGDPNPLTIRDVKRDGKSTVLVDVVAPPDAATVNLFVEGPTPDWGLPVPKAARAWPARRQAIRFRTRRRCRPASIPKAPRSN